MRIFLLNWALWIATWASYGQCALTMSPSSLSTCPGDSLTVNVTGGTNYVWTPTYGLSCSNCSSPTVYIDSAVTYTVTSTTSGSQNAVNWDFSSGNTGFTTQYIYNPTSIWNEGTYAVGPSANAVHPNFAAWGDHTTGTGNYMIINGSTNGIKTIWSQTVALPAGSSATLSLWMLTLATPAGQFRIKINGTLIGTNQTTPATVGVWGNYTFPFTVPASGNALVVIESVSTLLAGNDFGLDDIQFTYSCTANASLQVQPYPVPEAHGLPSDTLGCPGMCVNWMDSSTVDVPGQIVWRQWDWGDGTQDTGRFPSHCYDQPGVYNGTLYVVTSTGCTHLTALPSVQIASPPTVMVVFDPTEDCSTPIGSATMVSAPPTLSVNQPLCFHYQIQGGGWGAYVPAGTFLEATWMPVGIQPTGQTFSVAVGQPMNTWISGSLPTGFNRIPEELCFALSFPGGCGDTVCVPVQVEPRVELPNMFSPNQDGINDLFMPRYTYVEWVEWAVYSRWGQKVFETSDPTLGWDGKFQGRDVSDGVYFIELRAGNHRDPTVIRLNGSIHLIR